MKLTPLRGLCSNRARLGSVPRFLPSSCLVVEIQLRRVAALQWRTFSCSSPINNPKSPLPTVPTCPPNTCDCSTTPTGLAIDHTKPLKNTVARYSQHVVLCSGQRDWPSREQPGSNTMTPTGSALLHIRETLIAVLSRQMPAKDALSTATNLRLNAASFTPSSVAARPAVDDGQIRRHSTSAYLFPSFRYVPNVLDEAIQLEAFCGSFLAPQLVSSASVSADLTHKETAFVSADAEPLVPQSRPVDELIVLICGHASRDERCGKMGPVLEAEFCEKLGAVGFDIADEHETSSRANAGRPVARVGLISHIGGHAFAGNVILYIPPTFGHLATRASGLAGTGVWYGRVEPRHVEGIVNETVLKGTVIEDLLRGVLGSDGRMIS